MERRTDRGRACTAGSGLADASFQRATAPRRPLQRPGAPPTHSHTPACRDRRPGEPQLIPDASGRGEGCPWSGVDLETAGCWFRPGKSAARRASKVARCRRGRRLTAPPRARPLPQSTAGQPPPVGQDGADHTSEPTSARVRQLAPVGAWWKALQRKRLCRNPWRAALRRHMPTLGPGARIFAGRDQVHRHHGVRRPSRPASTGRSVPWRPPCVVCHGPVRKQGEGGRSPCSQEGEQFAFVRNSFGEPMRFDRLRTCHSWCGPAWTPAPVPDSHPAIGSTRADAVI